MDDKRYCLATVGGLIFLYLCLTAFLWLVPNEMYMDAEYPYWMQQRDYIEAEGDREEILFLGDSAFKAAVLPEVIAPEAYNFALGGGTAIEMCYALETYLERHPKPKAVFIAFGSVHYADIESYQTRTMYFHYLPFREAFLSQYRILSMDGMPYEKIPDWVLGNLQYMLRFPTKYFRTLWTSRLERGEGNRQAYESVSSAKGHRLFGTDGEWMKHYKTYEVLLRPFRPLPSVDHYMRRMLDRCKAEGIPVRVFQIPVHELDYNIIRSNGYLEDYLAYMDRLERETGVPVEKELPVYDLKEFGDFMHVNAKGAARYSRELKEKLQKESASIVNKGEM